MMRYSEISRDLSSDSLKYVELGGDECIYNSLHEESPPSDISTYSGPLLNGGSSTSAHHHQQQPQQQQTPKNSKNDLICQGYTKNPIQQSNGKTIHSCLQHSKRLSGGCSCSGNSNRNAGTSSNNNSGNGSANGAATISYARQRKDSTRSNDGCHVVDGERFRLSASRTMNSKNSRRKNSIGCLNALSSSPGSPGCYYSIGSATPPPGKTQSLPAQSSIKSYDAVILSALRVSADELACQITLLDFPVFAAIQPDELTSCAWTKKDKHVVTPNIVAFTKRFNHTSFWTVQEILSGEQPKQRAEILTHFIKVAKKLHELNNLHSLFAVISALQSASIYRLKKSWACVSKKDKQSFERLNDIFSDRSNWSNLREYLESLRLPCIPYLGLFLTDLIYIDLAHPHKGGLEPEKRRNKMNNILRVIANYQQSDYNNSIQPIEATQKYLTSIRYIEELQNIFEEDQYKKSLKLEPASPSGPSSSSCSSKESFNVDAITPALACLNLSPAKTISSMRVTNGGTKFIPGHRKCRSLGSNIFGKITNIHNDFISNNAPGCTDDSHHDRSTISHQPRHLLDDSVLEYCQHPVTGSSDATSTGSSEGVLCHFEGASDVDLMFVPADNQNCVQGCVRRKTVQKEGRKPAVASWQRYWLQIWANSLVYFPPKSFKGSERSDFKREPCKVCPLDGWSAYVIDNPKHKNSFELYHPAVGTIYKFRTDSAQATHLWTNSICKVAMQRSVPKPLPVNLMSFE